MCGGEAAISFLFVLLYYSPSLFCSSPATFARFDMPLLLAQSVCLSRISSKTNMHIAAIGQESFKWLCTLSCTHTNTDSRTYTRYNLRTVFSAELKSATTVFRRCIYWIKFVCICVRFYIQTFRWSSLFWMVIAATVAFRPRFIRKCSISAIWFKDS